VKTSYLLSAVIALMLGTTATFHFWAPQTAFLAGIDDSAQALNGAFRDGLYQGRLDARRGTEPHVASGRWATDQDRAWFRRGYWRGYSELLASKASPGRSSSMEAPQGANL
jgi:hypothetical protein